MSTTPPAEYSPEAQAVIKLVTHDMSEGHVPSGLTSFSELHTYVDANLYFIDADLVSTCSEAELAVCNRVAEEVSAWLKAGAPE